MTSGPFFFPRSRNWVQKSYCDGCDGPLKSRPSAFPMALRLSVAPIRRRSEVLKKASLYAIVIGFLCASAYAQSWPIPSYTTPDTPVNCTECQSGALNLPTPGWHDPVVRYVGRFVSSEYVADFQQVCRTARAKGVVFSPDGSRIAVRLGQGVATYDTG